MSQYKCPICRQPYNSEKAAKKCAEKYGYPSKPKYKIGDIVNFTINSKKFQGKIKKLAYSQPSWLSRKPHILIYLIQFQPYKPPLQLTTLTENEIIEKQNPK